jgi:hypothetical protein
VKVSRHAAQDILLVYTRLVEIIHSIYLFSFQWFHFSTLSSSFVLGAQSNHFMFVSFCCSNFDSIRFSIRLRERRPYSTHSPSTINLVVGSDHERGETETGKVRKWRYHYKCSGPIVRSFSQTNDGDG